MYLLYVLYCCNWMITLRSKLLAHWTPNNFLGITFLLPSISSVFEHFCIWAPWFWRGKFCCWQFLSLATLFTFNSLPPNTCPVTVHVVVPRLMGRLALPVIFVINITTWNVQVSLKINLIFFQSTNLLHGSATHVIWKDVTNVTFLLDIVDLSNVTSVPNTTTWNVLD